MAREYIKICELTEEAKEDIEQVKKLLKKHNLKYNYLCKYNKQIEQNLDIFLEDFTEKSESNDELKIYELAYYFNGASMITYNISAQCLINMLNDRGYHTIKSSGRVKGIKFKKGYKNLHEKRYERKRELRHFVKEIDNLN